MGAGAQVVVAAAVHVAFFQGVGARCCFPARRRRRGGRGVRRCRRRWSAIGWPRLETARCRCSGRRCSPRRALHVLAFLRVGGYRTRYRSPDCLPGENAQGLPGLDLHPPGFTGGNGRAVERAVGCLCEVAIASDMAAILRRTKGRCDEAALVLRARSAAVFGDAGVGGIQLSFKGSERFRGRVHRMLQGVSTPGFHRRVQLDVVAGLECLRQVETPASSTLTRLNRLRASADRTDPGPTCRAIPAGCRCHCERSRCAIPGSGPYRTFLRLPVLRAHRRGCRSNRRCRR